MRKDRRMELKDKDTTLFGTKIFNNETQEMGILLYTWTNSYADGDVPFAKCVGINGKVYNTPMDNISPIDD